MKQTKRVVVFQVEEHDCEWPPEDAKQFVRFFQAKLAEIPGDWFHTARVEIASWDGYANIEISYKRPETDAEKQEREQRASQYHTNVRERELRKLAELKAKYPDA